MMNTIKYLGIFLLFSVLAVACTKDFDKINTSPNAPSDAPETNLLAFGIQNLTNVWDSWGNINEPSSYGGHIGKIQYIDEARYQFRTNIVENIWSYLYRGLKSLDVVEKAAAEQGNLNIQAAAIIMKAYYWQLATDRWRDIPFVEALQADQGKLTPTYSTQEEIYPVLLASLKQANDLFKQSSLDELGEGDILFDGDLQKWEKFANSLRLRIAIRISKIDPSAAQSVIQEIMSAPTENPIISSNEDNAYLVWPGAGSTTVLTSEPWYTSLSLGSPPRLDNYAVSNYLIDTLKAFDDNRIGIYAQHPANDPDGYNGTVIGPDGTTPIGGITNYSFIGTRFYSSATGETPLLGAAEVQFILAEAANNGWAVGKTAKEAYEAGIDFSFEENGVSVGAYKDGTRVAWNGDTDRIYVQKWIALFKNGHEAWAEARRTDIPKMSAAPASPYNGHNRPPFRYPYPDTEKKLNGKNSAEYVNKVTDNFWGQQMWWDTRTGVQ